MRKAVTLSAMRSRMSAPAPSVSAALAWLPITFNLFQGALSCHTFKHLQPVPSQHGRWQS
jgi:hypothetical protein